MINEGIQSHAQGDDVLQVSLCHKKWLDTEMSDGYPDTESTSLERAI